VERQTEQAHLPPALAHSGNGEERLCNESSVLDQADAAGLLHDEQARVAARLRDEDGALEARRDLR
jgi:hypothetical protein